MKIKLDPGAIIPTRAHATDAGLDLYSMEEKTIYVNGSRLVDSKSGIDRSNLLKPLIQASISNSYTATMGRLRANLA